MANDKFNLVPSHVVRAGAKTASLDDLAVIAFAKERTVNSFKDTVAEVAVPHSPPPVTTTLYFVPFAGRDVVVLVMVKEALVTPE